MNHPGAADGESWLGWACHAVSLLVAAFAAHAMLAVSLGFSAFGAWVQYQGLRLKREEARAKLAAAKPCERCARFDVREANGG